MKRAVVLGVVIGVGAFSIAVAGQQRGRIRAHQKVIESDKIRENLHVLKGGGGNSAAFITARGVILVDSDHVSGNVEFPATIDIVAHENNKAEIEAWRPVTGLATTFPNVFSENDGKGLPNRTFKDRLSIGSGNERVDLYYFGRGHTGGDAWVVFPSLRA